MDPRRPEPQAPVPDASVPGAHAAEAPGPSAWDAAVQSAGHGWRVREARLEDIPAIVALMRRVYPPDRHGPEAVWREETLRNHLVLFPQGQWVAEDDERLLATSTTMRLPLGRALGPHTWSEITTGGTLSNHDPEGEALYGVNLAVDPETQGQGVGSALYATRLELARELGCRAFVAGARIPGYHRAAGELSPEAYVEQVAAGERVDPTLSKQLALGFQVERVLPGYAPDPECLDHAVLIVKWL